MALRLRRGTEAQRVITPEQGELLYVTDTKKVYVGDGATVGGILVGPVDAALFDVLSDTTPQLGGNLDLNGRDITGTGNININGTITATGSINLGNGTEDNINVGGLISSSLTPSVDDQFSLGSLDKQWASIWATQVNVDTTLGIGSQIIKLSSGTIDSDIVLWDAETDTLNVANIVGNLVGSVFADDSIKLVDGVTGTLHTSALDLEDNLISTSNGTNVIISDTGLEISSGLAEGNFGLTITGEATSTGTSTSMNFFSVHGTKDAPTAVEAGDVLSAFTFNGFNGISFAPSAALAIFSNATTTGAETTVDSTIGLYVGTGTGNITDVGVTLSSNGVFSMPIAKVAGYATTSLPTGPEEGWIVFDSTSKEFKGWNGSSWVVLG